MQKRGQLFLIAAFVIIAILIGLGTVYVSTNAPKEDTQVYDLSKEVDFEASQVIDNGVFTGKSQSEIDSRIQNITTTYAKLNPESDIAVYYGNASQLNVITYTVNEAGRIGFDFGGTPLTVSNLPRRIVNKGTLSSTVGGTVEVKFGNPPISNKFNLTPGQNFFIVIKKEAGNERTVAAQ